MRSSLRWFGFMLILLISVGGSAQSSDSGSTPIFSEQGHQGLPAHRDPKTPYHQIVQSVGTTLRQNPHGWALGTSVLDERAKFAKAAWERVPEMKMTELTQSFAFVRDQKPFVDSNRRDRRASWIYPDDGCFVRAVAAVDLVNSMLKVKPAKIFAFDNLSVDTRNSPSGKVTWWYHVAAIAKVGSDYYVYDPALDPQSPTEVKQWLALMHSPNAEISICVGAAYDPGSDCAFGANDPTTQAKNEAGSYLDYEWERIEELGRVAADETGDYPPWSPRVAPTPTVPVP